MKRNAYIKKLLFALAGGIFVTLGVVPLQANAQGVSMGLYALREWVVPAIGTAINIPFTVLKGVSFGLTYIISVVFGVIIAVEAWVVEVILSKNIDVLSSPVIAKGFPVVLSVANLGFVIGIIVIAIMTIIRSQSYGMKQILWKLVFMAIIVNFGLVICGVILNFSDSLTMYWLNSTTPAGSVGGATNGGVGIHNFATSFAGSFSPQKAFIENIDFGKANVSGQAGKAIGDATYGPIIGILFTLFTLISIAIVLAVFGVMLIVRYVYLVFLLVLLPLAWVSWVFPHTKNNWDKWWHTFLQQAFFPPLVVFFIWLTITTSKGLRTQVAGNSLYLSDSNPILAPIANIVGNMFASVVGNFLDAFVLCALSLGGIYAANKIGIQFASAGVSAMKSAGRGFAGYVGKRTGGTLARAIAPRDKTKAASWRSPMSLLNPRALLKTETAQQRGYTEALAQYGKKTDFKRPKELWKEFKTHEAQRDDLLKKQGQATQDAQARKVALQPQIDQAKTNADNHRQQASQARQAALQEQNKQKKAAHIQNADIHDKEAKKFDDDAAKLMQDIEQRETAAKNFGVEAEAETKKAIELKVKTWEALSSNRGPVSSVLLGALEGAGIYGNKSKLKLSKDQLDKLAKQSGVTMGPAAPAPTPTPAPSGAAAGGGTP